MATVAQAATPNNRSRSHPTLARSQKLVPPDAASSHRAATNPEACQRHLQQFSLPEPPPTPSRPDVHENGQPHLASQPHPIYRSRTASQASDPQSQIPLLSKLGRLPPVPKSSRSARRGCGTHRLTPFCASPPSQRSGRNPQTPSAQRTSLRPPPTFPRKLASFFQKNKLSATHCTSF
jgi:hypothetical protein